ncbi:hypothetical protein PHYSODRAFT_306379 [Phytophthora sojae]|uniref:Uncharacterized protein n=1 Tax=Phytophthora sojae (strain P6497) TaxID=1094619 RepID=G5A9B3_PHYSP|nr:hypothetical protein PHYSODRAFT_306379 [Phytophthora sojae]EGZ08489.1 hypothetical protein PHYSODRAFT_306379 [Phytophthora sojae]|eukprot:XP_009536661.1 hypothetical protein PHYSODRAFT_306379 [Phytophthora sojae]
MPANEAWNWSSPDTQFEFFADENDQNDVALVAIELATDEPLPYPTIMPDINNVVLGDWSHGTIFFSIFFRSGDGDEEEGEEMFPHYVDFKSSSVELGGTLHHQAKTEEGDSGGMLYCYADDPEKLVPACVITVQWIGVDHSHTYSVKQVGALQTLWKMTRQTLDERNSCMLYCGTKFASSDQRPQPPAPMRHPEQPYYMALSRLEFICDFFSDVLATLYRILWSNPAKRQDTSMLATVTILRSSWVLSAVAIDEIPLFNSVEVDAAVYSLPCLFHIPR